MNKKLLALLLTFFVGSSVGAVKWPWEKSSKVAPEDRIFMEPMPSEAEVLAAKKRAERTGKSSSPLKRRAYLVDGSPESKLLKEHHRSTRTFLPRIHGERVLSPAHKRSPLAQEVSDEMALHAELPQLSPRSPRSKLYSERQRHPITRN